MEITIQDLRDAIAELKYTEELRGTTYDLYMKQLENGKRGYTYAGASEYIIRYYRLSTAIAVIEREIKAMGEAGEE